MWCVERQYVCSFITPQFSESIGHRISVYACLIYSELYICSVVCSASVICFWAMISAIILLYICIDPLQSLKVSDILWYRTSSLNQCYPILFRARQQVTYCMELLQDNVIHLHDSKSYDALSIYLEQKRKEKENPTNMTSFVSALCW